MFKNTNCHLKTILFENNFDVVSCMYKNVWSVKMYCICSEIILTFILCHVFVNVCHPHNPSYVYDILFFVRSKLYTVVIQVILITNYFSKNYKFYKLFNFYKCRGYVLAMSDQPVNDESSRSVSSGEPLLQKPDLSTILNFFTFNTL